MITERDFIQLPFTRDLTEAGLLFARRQLQNRRGVTSYDSIRRTAASAALSLCFRRYLGENGIAFGVDKPSPFSDPDRYDVRLGGRMCELKTYLISRASQWQRLSEDPQLALDAPALVPLDRHTRETVRGRDVYAFAFVGAQVDSHAGHADVHGERGEYWMHLTPRSWRLPQDRKGLGKVILKAEGSADIPLVLEGSDQSGLPTATALRLSGGKRVEVDDAVWGLSHAYASSRPVARVGIHSAARRRTHVIEPTDWHNVWLDGWGMILLGWITREEFRTRGKLIPEGRRVFQFDRTRTRNLAVAVSNLKPMAELIGSSAKAGLVS